MTTTAPAKLGRFEGRKEARSSITITKAGAGLDDPCTVAPAAFKTGDEVFVLLKCTVGPIRHKLLKDVDEWDRNHTLETESATFVDQDIAEPLINDMLEKVAAARANDPTLFGDEPDDDDDLDGEG